MPRSNQTAEFNTFVGGIVTDVSPLTFPENSSIDEDNFVLLRDGSRRRRLGMDLEENYVGVVTDVLYNEDMGLTTSSHQWKNVGGAASKAFVVVQVGAKLFVFDTAQKPISANLVYSVLLSISTEDLKEFSYATVDGKLVIATGGHDVEVLEYDSTTEVVTKTTTNIKIRDSFGVEDVDGTDNLLEGLGLSVRPSVQTPEHTYNLRNQTWAVPRAPEPGHNPPVEDSLSVWRQTLEVADTFPSNSDATVYALSVNPVADNAAMLRLKPTVLISNELGSFRAPTGYFIIDMMQRGTSRKEQVAELHTLYPSLVFGVGTLPIDKTPGGASVLAEFAGRVWYGGFSGDVSGGDSQSPNLSSYVAYSQLVKNTADINKCYQDGDPTSDQFPDLLDTDGGFIKIDGSYNIQHLVAAGDGLLVVAENGVWRVSGGTDKGFTANSHIVTKISEHGTTSPNSAVLVDGTLMFWGDDAIYHVATNEFGDWISQSISDSIGKYFSAISSEEKAGVAGIYDSYDKKVRWLYSPKALTQGDPRELVFDVLLKAFYPTSLGSLSGGMPRAILPVETPPFNVGGLVQTVVNGVDVVQHLGVDVVNTSTVRQEATREVVYVTITATSPTTTISFSEYRDPSFLDWVSVDAVGVDAPAFLLTGYINNGDYQKTKQVPYVFFHLRRTEDGFEDDGTDIVPTNQSSCKVQAQWDWANSANSGRWGKEFQAYRYKRKYSGQNVGDPYDTGFLTIVTKNKLRGKGRVVSLLIKSEPSKDLDLLGWSLTLGMNNNV